jgi:hypothetical protein
MRTIRWPAALGLAAWGGLAAALASDLTGKPVSAANDEPAAQSAQAAPPKTDEDCGSHGTAVDFVANPKEAAALAAKQQKLVFVLHVSGHFEDPQFT